MINKYLLAPGLFTVGKLYLTRDNFYLHHSYQISSICLTIKNENITQLQTHAHVRMTVRLYFTELQLSLSIHWFRYVKTNIKKYYRWREVKDLHFCSEYSLEFSRIIIRDYYMCFSISSWYYPETSISARGPLGQRADMGRGIIPGWYGKTHVIIFLSHIQRYKAALQNMFRKNKQPL